MLTSIFVVSYFFLFVVRLLCRVHCNRRRKTSLGSMRSRTGGKANGKLDRSPLVSFVSDDSDHEDQKQLPDVVIVGKPLSRPSSPVAAVLNSVASVIRCSKLSYILTHICTLLRLHIALAALLHVHQKDMC